jgi:hypothetical protein
MIRTIFKTKALWYVLAVFSLLFIFKYCLIYFIQIRLERISEFYGKVESVDMLISNRIGDGSEILVENIDKPVQDEIKSIIKYLNIYCLSQKRVFIHLTKSQGSPIVNLEIETQKMWNDSFSIYECDWWFSTSNHRLVRN